MQQENKKQLTFWTFFTLEALVLLAIFISCFGIFFFLTKEIFLDKEDDFDKAAFAWLATKRSTFMTDLMQFITYFASKRFLLSVPAALIVFFLLFKKWRWFSAQILSATLGSFLLNQYLKNNFGRLRPETAFYHQSGFSFPSGHAMIGGAFYGVLIYLSWVNIENKWLRLVVCIALLIWQLLIAVSRVYLNVHYATDVIAGLSAGLFWVVLSVILVRQLERYFYLRERHRRLNEIRKIRRARGF
ncbi:phosphatase PAP2 family protein [Adhaeribacter sp. BT258]|uniref:Phosphatase PAP2 family protein n=1 Tax=Adhaeribacter terrigena TaxID=2793070 RepID=A0ABS1BY27_9BACT|nr:phosphatase PAP2 family protein [Adhaeribacter terrigena]MBK0402049.1 phosphatase PAP2 family protein [Adhaeribacter terrigena]